MASWWGVQVMDAYLRDRAEKKGAKVYNGLYLRSEQDGSDGPFTITFSDYTEGGKVACCPQDLAGPCRSHGFDRQFKCLCRPDPGISCSQYSRHS